MRITFIALLSLVCPEICAEPVTVAVASNFAAPVAELVTRFEESTGYEVRTSTASTGVLYAAIANGAGYVMLLAADEERPRRLEASGEGVPGTRFTYAIGRLELWSVDAGLEDTDCRDVLENLGKRRLAIANPVTAPYGIAAKSFLQNEGLWEHVEANVVYGQNIAQTMQFVATGNASLGLVARSHAESGNLPEPTCRWPVPATLHEPIEQQAILLRAGADSDTAIAFLNFLRSTEGRAIIQSHGYEVPD